MSSKPYFEGVFPANNMPFKEDLSIDEEALGRHISWLAGFELVAGIVTNGHAAEVELLTRGEKRRAIQITMEAVNKKKPVIGGVCAYSQTKAVQYAKDAKEEGVDAIMVFPLPQFGHGSDDWEIPYYYFKAIDDAVNLPIVIFQYAERTGCDYSPQTLAKLCEIKNIVAIKDASLHFEADYIAISELPRKVAMLTCKGNLFLARFQLADGAVSSFSNVLPHEVTLLYKLAKEGRIDEAKALSRSISPLSKAIYHEPHLQHWVREKASLVARGRFPNALMRPPFRPLKEAEWQVIQDAVHQVQPVG